MTVHLGFGSLEYSGSLVYSDPRSDVEGGRHGVVAVCRRGGVESEPRGRGQSVWQHLSESQQPLTCCRHITYSYERMEVSATVLAPCVSPLTGDEEGEVAFGAQGAVQVRRVTSVTRAFLSAAVVYVGTRRGPVSGRGGIPGTQSSGSHNCRLVTGGYRR